MADLKRWPWALNQPGYDYPAELVRAEHHDATSGGNGVGAPTALKVTAQSAPDGTVSILPGGATVKSTYAGADGQSYHARNFQPFTLTVPQTGSGGSRTDLVILRVCDPQYDSHPDHGGGEISAEEAANLDFWWFELLQGQNRNTSLSYPHVKLAELVRPASTTIVSDAHIRDLRQLASPKSERFYRARNLNQGEEQGAHTNSTVWPTAATQTVHIPVWATRVQVAAHWGTVRTGPTTDNPAHGNVQVALVHPDGSERLTQASRWTSGTEEGQRFGIALGHVLSLPGKWRGVDVTVEMRGVRNGGNSSPRMDSMSSYILDLWFEQGVA